MEDTANTERLFEPEEPPRNRGRLGLIIFVAFMSALLGTAVGAVGLAYLVGIDPFDANLGRVVPVLNPSRTVIETEGNQPVEVAVAEKVKPSVVNIRTQRGISRFGRGGGEGSGVIFRKDGYILTNDHVVADASRIFVSVPGRPDMRGRVIGRDPDTDLAIVKVDAKDLPAAEIGSSDDLKVGELVVAVGSPFSFEQTVTSGIVSATNRNVSSSDDDGRSISLTGLIQTDAAINPGNSGGALADGEGRVVGISALIFSRDGGNQGIGFAIPIDLAKKVATQLIDKGKVSHAYLGIAGNTLDREFAASRDLKTEMGALIVNVESGTAAAEAGLREDDIIISLDGKPVETMEELIAVIRDLSPGDKVDIKYVRSGKTVETQVTLGEKPR
ncbi:MAG: S1C family serine protease [Terriglobia bacterium]